MDLYAVHSCSNESPGKVSLVYDWHAVERRPRLSKHGLSASGTPQNEQHDHEPPSRDMVHGVRVRQSAC